jgi:uncharacterized protein YlzI (FlbEa/FlbD family)
MKFIQLERPDGSPVWVNPAAVATVAPEGKPGLIHLNFAGAMQVVRGELAEVVAKLTGGDNA